LTTLLYLLNIVEHANPENAMSKPTNISVMNKAANITVED